MKLICVGMNYVDDAEQPEHKKLTEPVLFLKPDSAILSKNHPFFIPPYSNEVHHELEVLVRINKLGKYIDKKYAHKYYNHIGLGIDFTALDLHTKQKAKGLPWEIAKAFDGAAVVGNWLPKTQFDDINNINFSLKKNNEVVQLGNTKHMLWTINELIAYVSQFFTLKIGDIIFTGTPSGVAQVKENDVLQGFIENKELFNVKVK